MRVAPKDSVPHKSCTTLYEGHGEGHGGCRAPLFFRGTGGTARADPSRGRTLSILNFWWPRGVRGPRQSRLSRGTNRRKNYMPSTSLLPTCRSYAPHSRPNPSGCRSCFRDDPSVSCSPVARPPPLKPSRAHPLGAHQRTPLKLRWREREWS